MRVHARSAVLTTLLLGLPAASAAKGPRPEDLVHPFLEGELAQWLVGPIGAMASRDEIEGYLALRDKEAARSYIEEFWARRDDDPDDGINRVRQLFEQRAEEADRRYTEAAYAGRRTDRGTVYILYGDPDETEYEQFVDVEGPDVELWQYDKKSPPGLDGRRPQRRYRFARVGDVTTFYSPRDPGDPRHRRTGGASFPGSVDSPPGSTRPQLRGFLRR